VLDAKGWVGTSAGGEVGSTSAVAEGTGSAVVLANGRLQARVARSRKVGRSRPRGFIGNPPVGNKTPGQRDRFQPGGAGFVDAPLVL